LAPLSSSPAKENNWRYMVILPFSSLVITRSCLSRLLYELFSFLVVLLLVACRNQEAAQVGQVTSSMVKIQVAEDGIYKVSWPALQAAGLALDKWVADTVHLSQAGTAVPFVIDDDSLIFYGQAPTSRYTGLRPYILQVGPGGVTMEETAVANTNASALQQLPVRVRLEENTIYETRAMATDNHDLWFWQTLGPQQKLPFAVNLPAIADGSATLYLHLWGFTHDPNVANDHDFDLIVNEQRLETVRWDGRTFHTAQVALPAGALQVGENSIILDNEVEGVAIADTMRLDWLELVYMAPPIAVADRLEFSQSEGSVALTGFSDRPLIFDVSNPAAPKQMVSWNFSDNQALLRVSDDMQILAVGPNGFLEPASIEPMRQSDWRNLENQADLIIITTDELAPGLAPLITAREAQGLAVALVPIAEIYDAFGFGETTPDALNAFVTYAYEQWREPRPRYLFLVGDATSDYRNYLGQAPRNQIPSPMTPVEFSGETVSDSRLADVDGDVKPDLAIGRWPVDDVAQVKSLVERTLAYEQSSVVDRALFAVDGAEPYFTEIAHRLSQASDASPEQVVLLTGPPASEVISQWNKGAWLATYIGHGSVAQWGKENVLNLEAINELQALPPPIVLQLTCLTGLFTQPGQLSLSEAMLAHDQGPVLLIAATSLTLSTSQEPFALRLVQELKEPAVLRIGDAFQNAKRSLAIEDNGLREVSDTFVLLGDPSTLIARP
jgi:hypothetical protein